MWGKMRRDATNEQKILRVWPHLPYYRYFGEEMWGRMCKDAKSFPGESNFVKGIDIQVQQPNHTLQNQKVQLK